MFCDFDSIFHQTVEQKINQYKLAIDAIRYCIQKQDCVSCKYSTVIDDVFPSAPPEILCSLGLLQGRSENRCEGFFVSPTKMKIISDLEEKMIELKDN